MKSSTRIQSGSTLLELLLVLGIVGVLLGIVYANYQRSIWSGRVQEAAGQVAADLRRARSLSQRQSSNTSITFTSTTGSAK